MPRSNMDMSLPGIVDLRRPNGGIVNTSWPHLTTSVRTVETTSGTSRRKPSGWIPPTAYSFFYRCATYAKGECRNIPNTNNLGQGQVYTGTVGYRSDGCFNSENHWDGLVAETALVDPSLANQALIQARNRVKSSDINLGVAFAERNRTAQLVGDTAIRIAKSIRSLRRGEIRSAMRSLGLSSGARQPRGSSVPQKWLELQYGWKPLLSDVYGACDALSKRNKKDWRVTAKASRSSKKVYTATWSSFDAGSGGAEVDCSAFVRIDALPANEATISLASLGITNPLVIGWELVPFSFVADWFIPIGGYLESLDAMLGYTSMSTSTSVRTIARWWGNGRKIVTSSTSYIDNNYSESKLVKMLNRTVSSGVPLPSFPGFKDPRSLGHMANGLALLSQVFGRR